MSGRVIGLATRRSSDGLDALLTVRIQPYRGDKERLELLLTRKPSVTPPEGDKDQRDSRLDDVALVKMEEALMILNRGEARIGALARRIEIELITS